MLLVVFSKMFQIEMTDGRSGNNPKDWNYGDYYKLNKNNKKKNDHFYL